MNNESELRAIMADIENDAIDKSQWIFKRDEVVTQARKDRGEISSHNGTYAVLIKMPIDILLSREYIDQDQHTAALDMISLHAVALSAQGYARLRFVAQWLGRSTDTGECPMTIYVRVRRRLLPWQSSMVDRICFQEVRTNDWGWIEKYRASIEKSFDNLKKAIDEVRGIVVQSETKSDFARLQYTTPANEN